MKINAASRIIPPSFGALYTVKAQDNPDKADNIADLERRYSRQREGISAYSETSEDNCSTTNFVAEDFNADDRIETILANKGIKFERTSFSKLTSSPESIKERVVLSPDEKARGFKLVEVNKTEFDSKYEFWGIDYIGNKFTGIEQPERMDKFENYLKTGKKIYAPVVYINDDGKHPQIGFDDGRHRYAYMRDIGIRNIPVAMNEDSIKIAKKYGLLA